MSQTIRVTYRQPGAAPTAEMHLPLIDKSAITVLADITYPDGERVLIFSREGSMAYCEGRSMETRWPGALFGASIDTPVDPRDAMILDLGEGGAFVCRSGRGVPFIYIDRWSSELLKVCWPSVDEVADHVRNDAGLGLNLPGAQKIAQEAGIKVDAAKRVYDPSLIQAEDRAEDELFELLDKVEAETEELHDFACDGDPEFPDKIGEADLLGQARAQARSLWLLRAEMNERIKL